MEILSWGFYCQTNECVTILNLGNLGKTSLTNEILCYVAKTYECDEYGATTLLVSYGCCNKLPCIWWLKTTQYYLTALEV